MSDLFQHPLEVFPKQRGKMPFPSVVKSGSIFGHFIMSIYTFSVFANCFKLETQLSSVHWCALLYQLCAIVFTESFHNLKGR